MRSPGGASAEILRRVRSRQLRMACSVSLFMEYEAVCSRAVHLDAAGWHADDLAAFALITFNHRHFLPATHQFQLTLLTPSQFLKAHHA